MGKTALARAVAAEVKDRFPDARVEVDLYGFTPGASPAEPRAVLAELLSWVGFEVASIPESLDGRARLWRGWLAARQVLLLLDNVRTVEQIVPLLPQGAPRCLTLVTSRSSLDELDEADPLSWTPLLRRMRSSCYGAEPAARWTRTTSWRRWRGCAAGYR